MTPADLLKGLAAELGAIDRLVQRGREAWDADELIRLAIERRWITAGNYAERYRMAAAVPMGVDPWAELYDYRCLLAHALPEQLDDERVWLDSVSDIARLRATVEVHRSQRNS